MQVLLVKNDREKKAFTDFRKKLYMGDPFYVSTAEFTFEMLLNKETAFAKTLDVCPVMGIENGKIVVEALLIRNPKDDFLQVSFFEAVENAFDEVEFFMSFVKDFALKKGVRRIIIGLNGHLSYGVGLAEDMNRPNTFDSTYSKPYYARYFKNYVKHELFAFSNSPSAVLKELPERNSSVTIRKIDFKHFDEEAETFRKICNETIGSTFLFTQTDKGHFYDLLKPMTFFLKPENILFAEKDGEVVGFVFWHPDYNEVLKTGRKNSLAMIALRYLLFKNKIKRVKLNSIGIKEKYRGAVTVELLRAVGKLVGNYETLETNFVWGNNKKSIAINRHLLKNVERKFAVYEVNL